MATAVPAIPVVGLTAAIAGRRTPKYVPVLANVAAVTTTLPLATPFGTVTVTILLDQLVTVAACPLKVTVPVVEVKFRPEMVTEAPGSALAGDSELMIGATVYGNPALCNDPQVVTTAFPLLAPVGTWALMLESDQLMMLACCPLKVTLEAMPWFGPK